jgi:hypothetical protein
MNLSEKLQKFFASPLPAPIVLCKYCKYYKDHTYDPICTRALVEIDYVLGYNKYRGCKSERKESIHLYAPKQCGPDAYFFEAKL